MSHPDLSLLRFQDLKIGDHFDLGEYVMKREAMIEFASKYDPQPFHLNDEAAQEHPLFERMSASGWQSVLVLQQMIASFWKHTKIRGLAGAGVDEIKWMAPTYAGDNLHCGMTIEMIRVSTSKPDRGLMTMRATVHKADGKLTTVLKITGVFAVA